MSISKVKSWYNKLKGPKGNKPMVVYHLGPEKIYKFRSVASFRGQAGMYVSPSIRSIFNDWYQTLRFKGDNKIYSKLYLHQILIDKNLYNQIEKDFYQQGKSDDFKQGFGFWGWGQQTFIPAKYLDRLKIISIKQYTYQQAKKIINYNQDIGNSNANKKMRRQWEKNHTKRQPIIVEKHIINKIYTNKDGSTYKQQNSVAYNCPKLNINNLYNQNKLREILIKNRYFVSHTKDIFQGKKSIQRQNYKQKDWVYYYQGNPRILGKIKIKTKIVSYVFN